MVGPRNFLHRGRGVQARQLCAVPLKETWKDHKPLDEFQLKVQRLLA